MLERKKLLVFNTLYPPDVVGGAELSVAAVVSGLARHHEIVVVTTTKVGRKASIEENGIRVVRLKQARAEKVPRAIRKLLYRTLDIWNPFREREIKALIRSEEPDVVVTNNLNYLSTVVWKIGASMELPVVHVLRDLRLMCPYFMVGRGSCITRCSRCKVYNYRKDKHSQYVSDVVGISDFILKMHTDAGLFSKATRSVIHNGVERVSVSPELPVEGARRFGFIGSISLSKGIETLLEAFTASRVSGVLYIAGSGDVGYVDTLKRKFNDPRIVFMGYVQPAELFSKIDILVAPSIIREGFGRIVAEAYSCGVPVIASDHGAFCETVEDGVTGWRFKPADVFDLVQVLNKAHDCDDNAMERMQGECLSAYHQHYRIERLGEEYKKLVDRVLCR
jgi:glycosyltransferase involved in cell wall biosynthesis